MSEKLLVSLLSESSRRILTHAIGFTGQFYIEPKLREPATHQYDYDAAACLNFFREYDLSDQFKLNLETNHATLVEHTMWHEMNIPLEANALESVEANQGDTLLSWNTDQFPTDIYLTTNIMLRVIKMGNFTTDVLNFDAKRHRESHELEDIFHYHIGSLDTFACGLEIARHIIGSGHMPGFITNRYVSCDTGMGTGIEKGNTTPRS